MNVRLIAWSEVTAWSKYLADWARDKKFTGVVAIQKGGLFPALIIANHLNLPIDSLSAQRRYDHAFLEIEEYKPIFKHSLIVDDIIDTGITMEDVAKQFRCEMQSFKTTCLLWKSQSRYKPDLYVEKIENDVVVIFPWENSEREKEKWSEILERRSKREG